MQPPNPCLLLGCRYSFSSLYISDVPSSKSCSSSSKCIFYHLNPTLMPCSLCIPVVLSNFFFPAVAPPLSVMPTVTPEVSNLVPTPTTPPGLDCQNCGQFIPFKPCQSNANGNRGRLVAMVCCTEYLTFIYADPVPHLVSEC